MCLHFPVILIIFFFFIFWHWLSPKNLGTDNMLLIFQHPQNQIRRTIKTPQAIIAHLEFMKWKSDVSINLMYMQAAFQWFLKLIWALFIDTILLLIEQYASKRNRLMNQIKCHWVFFLYNSISCMNTKILFLLKYCQLTKSCKRFVAQ